MLGRFIKTQCVEISNIIWYEPLDQRQLYLHYLTIIIDKKNSLKLLFTPPILLKSFNLLLVLMAHLRTLNYKNGYTLYKNSNFRPRMKCCFEVKDCCNSYTNLSCWSKRADSYSQLCCFDRTIGLFINDITHLGGRGGGSAKRWCVLHKPI